MKFETNRIEFGCILNDTETMKTITMTNSSPLEVHYVWSFLKRPPVYQKDPVHDDEGVDMQSECEIDSLEGSTISLGSQQQQAAPTSEAAPIGSTISLGSQQQQAVPTSEAAPVGSTISLGSQQQQAAPTSEAAPVGDDVRIEITSPSLQGQSLQSGEEESERDPHHVEEEEILPTIIKDEDIREPVFAESLPPSEHSESTVQSEIKISKDRGHQPWEAATDPFVPIGIEQVPPIPAVRHSIIILLYLIFRFLIFCHCLEY